MSVGASCFIFGLTHWSSTVGFLMLQHFSYSRLLSPNCCFISEFVWFCVPGVVPLMIRNTTMARIAVTKQRFNPNPSKKKYWPFQGGSAVTGLIVEARLCAYVLLFSFIFDSRLAILWQSDWPFGFHSWSFYYEDMYLCFFPIGVLDGDMW